MERIDVSAEKAGVSKIEFARKYWKDQGCTLHQSEWKGVMHKMSYTCKCGMNGESSWNNFTVGKRCGHCTKWGQKKKRSVKQVREIFAERGATFLDDEFKGIHYKHNYRCKCGRETVISFAAFHHQKQDCKQCGLEKNKGDGHHSWRLDREQVRLDRLFRKKLYKAVASSLKAIGKEKVGRTSDLLGYTPKQLQEYIMKHPDWDKVKNERWHIDHIWPIQAFVDHEIKDLKLINTLYNLRPMLGKDNEFKGAKYDQEEFIKWLALQKK